VKTVLFDLWILLFSAGLMMLVAACLTGNAWWMVPVIPTMLVALAVSVYENRMPATDKYAEAEGRD
jgi:hypothetical protein